MKKKEMKEEDFSDCEVDSKKVCKILSGFVLVNKVVASEEMIESAIEKLSNWIEESPG